MEYFGSGRRLAGPLADIDILNTHELGSVSFRPNY
jgi:hypothetical protein